MSTNSQEYWRQYYQAHRESLLEQQRLWRKAHPDAAKKKNAKQRKTRNAWNKAHRDTEKERKESRRRYARDPEKRREHSRAYRKANPGKVRESFRRSYAIPENRLMRICRSRFHKFVECESSTRRSREFLGCSFGFLRNHIESTWENGWSWENYGTIWVIDHVVPLAWFSGLLNDSEWQAVAFHWTNLQAKETIENIRKGARWAG